MVEEYGDSDVGEDGESLDQEFRYGLDAIVTDDDLDGDSDYSGSDDEDLGIGVSEGFGDDQSVVSEEEEEVDEGGYDFNVLGDEMDSFHQDLRAAGGFKKGTRAGRRTGEEVYSFEVRRLLGQANSAYAFGNLDEAMKLVKQIIHIEPGVYSAWKILGEIFKEKGDKWKCLLAWLTAAHAKPKDWELWIICAKMSLDEYGPEKQTFRDQAVYCYTRAISAKPDNIDAIYDRALLLKDLGQFGKAAEGFAALNRLLPGDTSVLKELAGLYIQIGKISDAIGFYERSVELFRSTGNPENGFGWSELNIFAELHFLAQDWVKAIQVIKSVGRWLYGRAGESYWDNINGDDREWDGEDSPRRCIVREFEPGKYPKDSYILPLELRVKLGLCRLKLHNTEEALRHFQYLLSETKDSLSYGDLFQEAADALYEARLYNEAISYYSIVVEAAEYLDRKLWFNMADCFKAIDRIEEAEDCYGTVLEAYPDDDEARMQLAGIYEVTNRKAEALELVNEIIRMRREKDRAERERKAEVPNATRAVPVQEEESMAFFPDQPVPERAKRKRLGVLTQAEREEMDARKTQQTEIRYRKLEFLRPNMERGDPEAVREWLDAAGDLVDDFRNTRALYPHERSAQFKGFMTTAQRRAVALGEARQIEKMQNRLKESLNFQEEDIEKPEHLVRFRGLDFDTWLYIFMQYAICLAKHDNYQDAYDVCNVAKEANVFYQDKKRKFTIYVTWLACAIMVGDSESCSTICRWFMTSFQFMSEAYNLFTGAVTISKNGLEVFHHNANQKYLLRQIKAMDQCITGKKRVGAANLTGGDESGQKFVPKETDVGLIMLYGHILASGRSYISALNYYTRAYAQMPNDPRITFCIGLAYIHRSMQRQSENRHMALLQGMTFLFDYYDMQCGTPDGKGKGKEKEKEKRWDEIQEAEYNVGRAFHHIGLSHLAIPYYERVLKISDENPGMEGDMKWEAAYNLQMIYITSGNPVVAMEITEKYLVI